MQWEPSLRQRVSSRWPMVRLLFVSAALLLCLPLLQSCHRQQHPPIRISLIDWPGFYPLYLAKTLGLYQQQGLEVELILSPDNPQANQLFETGGADLVAGPYADFITMQAEGVGVKVLTVFDYSKADLLMAAPAIHRVADLRGKPVGIDRKNSFSHLFVLLLLKKHGIPEEAANLREIPFDQVPDALSQGLIVAGHTWDPAAAEAARRGFKVLASAGELPGVISDCLAVSERMLQERPDELQRLMLALVEAQRWFASHPNEGLKQVAAFVKRPAGELAPFLAAVNTITPEQALQAFAKGPELTSLHSSGEIISKFLTDRGFTSTVPFETLLEPAFLQRALQGNKGARP